MTVKTEALNGFIFKQKMLAVYLKLSDIFGTNAARCQIKVLLEEISEIEKASPGLFGRLARTWRINSRKGQARKLVSRLARITHATEELHNGDRDPMLDLLNEELYKSLLWADKQRGIRELIKSVRSMPSRN